MTDIATLKIEVDDSDVKRAGMSLSQLMASAKKAEGSTQQLEQSARRLSSGMSGLSSALQAVATGMALHKLVAMADEYTNLHARLGLATDGMASLAAAESRLFAVSQNTRTSLGANVDLFTSLSRSTKALGLDQNQLIGITQTVAESFKISGASVSTTEGAVRQLGQAFASGVLRGDEFNSIAEGAPRIQEAVAASLHVSTNALRAMAAEGKLTSQVVAEALLKSAGAIHDEFSRIPTTVSGAMQQVHNSMLIAIGSIDSASQSTAGFANALTALAKIIPPTATALNGLFADMAISSAQVDVWLAKVELTRAKWQRGVADMLGKGGVGASLAEWLRGKAAENESGQGDVIALQEKRLQELVVRLTPALNAATAATNSHAASVAGTNKQTKEEIALAKALASIRTAAIVAADAADAKRLAGVRALQAEEEMQGRLLAGARIGTAALKAQTDAEEVRQQVAQAGIAIGDREYSEAVRAAKVIVDRKNAIEQLTKAQSDLQDMVTKGVETLRKVAKEGTENQAADQKKYLGDLQAIWQDSAGRIAADFVKSLSRGFEEVYSLAVKLMKRMEEEGNARGFGFNALKYGAAAIGGGLAGYASGGVLSGAASGAMTGAAFGIPGAVIGGLAGAAGGLLGASNAQKEAAEQMRLAALALQAQAGAFINASRSGNSVVDSLGANDASVAALLKAGGFAPSAGRTAHAKYTGADIEAAGARNAQHIADDFWAGITVSLNALNGPSGAYRNQLAEIEKQYESNRVAALALNASQAQLADIETIRTGRIAELNAAFAEAGRVSIVSSNIRTLIATGDAWGAQQLQMAERNKKEMDDLLKSMGDTIDPLAVAGLNAAQAAETAAAKWQHAQDVINQGNDWIAQQGAVFGSSPEQVFAQQTENFGFGGMTPEQVRGMFTTWTQGAQLTPDQKATNDHIATWFQSFNQLHPVDQLIAATRGPSSAYGASSALSAVSATVTDRTALMLVDINRSQLTTLDKIETNTRSGGASGGGGVQVHMTNNFHHEVTEDDIVQIVDRLEGEMDQRLGSGSMRGSIRGGNVRRS